MALDQKSMEKHVKGLLSKNEVEISQLHPDELFEDWSERKVAFESDLESSLAFLLDRRALDQIYVEELIERGLLKTLPRSASVRAMINEVFEASVPFLGDDLLLEFWQHLITGEVDFHGSKKLIACLDELLVRNLIKLEQTEEDIGLIKSDYLERTEENLEKMPAILFAALMTTVSDEYLLDVWDLSASNEE